MSTQTIEVEGFEIELASELYCDRGGEKPVDTVQFRDEPPRADA